LRVADVYGWIWRTLPGNLAAKTAESLVLLLGVLALLFFVLFPFVEPRLPWNESTVNAPTVSQQSSSSAPALPSGSVIPAG
jgi:hypothetical protein